VSFEIFRLEEEQGLTRDVVLAQVALDVGIIDGKVFVALVFMAIVTSVIPGPLLKRILRRPSTTSVMSIVPRNAFDAHSPASTMHEAIRAMANMLKHPEMANAAIERELVKAAPVWENLAIATAFSKDMLKPLAAITIFHDGLTWVPGESDPEHLVRYAVLLLIPESDHTIEFDLMREVSQLFASSKFRREIDNVKNIVELYALFQIEKYRQGMSGHNTNPTPIMALKETGMLAVDVNEIIQQSPRAQPSAPELVFSPRTVEMLQTANGIDQPATNDPDMVIEIKQRPQRRETAKSLLQTIEDYVGTIPDSSNHAQSPGGTEPRRKSTNLSPEDISASMGRIERHLSSPVLVPSGIPKLERHLSSPAIVAFAPPPQAAQAPGLVSPASFAQLNSASSSDSTARRSTLEDNASTSDSAEEGGDRKAVGNHQVSLA
jgi:mannitol/fructose-specific phosphotransferase system IIA component (Ntr-type)